MFVVVAAGVAQLSRWGLEPANKVVERPPPPPHLLLDDADELEGGS